MKKIYVFLLILFLCLYTYGQEKLFSEYEIEKNNMPAFYKQLKESLHYPLAWKNSKRSYKKWRKEARNQVYECLKELPPEAQQYDWVVLAKEKRNGYTAYKIVFNVSAWSRVPAYLLIPDGEGPFPALNLLHDHGGYFSIGKEKMVRPFAVSEQVVEAAEKWALTCYDAVFVGDFFAQNNYVVLAMDAIFWGERGQKDKINYDGQQAFASNLMQMGSSFCSVITADDLYGVDFLSSLKDVDSQKIGVWGFSMGGHRSWMASALSDKISASVSICWMNTTDSLMTLTNNQNKGGSAFSMLIPGIRRYLDYPDVASIACPKPTLFFNGAHDNLFPVEGVQSAYTTLQEVWKSQKASDKLVTKIWDEKHFCNQEMLNETLLFLNQWLKE